MGETAIMPNAQARRHPGIKLSPELTNILGVSGATLAIVGAGSAIALVLPSPDLMQIAAAYGVPACVAFAARWWMAQKL
jgi:hypothetical protein